MPNRMALTVGGSHPELAAGAGRAADARCVDAKEGVGDQLAAAVDARLAEHVFTERTRVVMATDFGVALSVMGLDPDGHVIEIQYPLGSGEPGFDPLDVDGLRRQYGA